MLSLTAFVVGIVVGYYAGPAIAAWIKAAIAARK